MDVKQFLLEGNKRLNPEYNPKTKKGASQPPFLVDYEPGNTIADKIANSVAKNIIAGTKTLDTKEYDKYAEYDVFLSSDTIQEDLNRERAQNQSWIEQTGRMLVQAGLGEIVYGSLEGFGNIFDGAKNLFTGGNYERSAWTKFWEEQKENVKENNEIYRVDPDKALAFNDWGWWMDNMVTVATTASLALPAAGWMKGLSFVGKATKLNKLGNSAIRATSRGLARGAKKAANATNFTALRSMAGKAGRIESTIKNTGSLALQATISRTGENFMEAKAVHDDVKTNIIENLNGMLEYDKENGTNEFGKFIANNKEFLNKEGVPLPIEEIASIIATKAANKTFYNDYAMLFMDYLQLRALGGLWGKQATRTPSNRQRIAAENVKRSLAGKTGEQLIKDNIKNRTKFALKDALKSPYKSITALQLTEGFEEIWQGIQSEKGYEVASKYFDPAFTPRTLSSYLSDGHIWEQGLWGVLGGIGYNGIVRGLQQGSKRIEGLWNKKHMSAEEYERWKKSNDKIAIEHLAGINARATKFMSDMEAINNNINPFEYIIDPITRKPIFKDGDLINETIDDIQKELLKEKAIDEFIKDTTLASVDAGTFDLLKDILTSSEFDSFIGKNNALNATDKLLTQQIVQRMNDIEGIYTSELTNINSMSDSSNPYTERLAARSITRSRLLIEGYDHTIENLHKQIDELNTSGTNYSPTERKIEAEYVNEMVKSLKQRYEAIKNDRTISDSARREMLKEISNQIRELYDVMGLPITDGKLFNGFDLDALSDRYTEILNEYLDKLNEGYETPPASIQNLIEKKSQAKLARAYELTKLPSTAEQYQKLYEEFGRATDQVIVNRLNSYIDDIKKYLRNAENLDEAIDRVLSGNTGNKKLNEAIDFLRYGFNSIYGKKAPSYLSDIVNNTQIATIIDGIRQERNADAATIAEAESEGTPLPEADPIAEETVEEEDSSAVSPSTGEEVMAPSAVPTIPVTGVGDEASAAVPPVGVTTSPSTVVDVSEESITLPFDAVVDSKEDDTIIDDSAAAASEIKPDEELTEKQKEEYASIAAQSETAKAKAEIAASEYIAKLASTNEALFEKISKELTEGNKDTYNKLINEIVEDLKTKGYSEKTAISAAQDAFVRVTNMFSDLKSKSVFYKLATQLANGFKLEGKELQAATGEITDEELDSIVEEFIEEYNKQIDNIQTEDGKYILNVYNIIKALLKEGIPTNVASRVYNNLFKFIDRHDGSKYIFTGYNEAVKVNATEFVEMLLQNSKQAIASADDLHIHPVEEINRDELYEEALIAAYNGSPVEVREHRDKNGEVTNLDVVVTMKKGRKTVEVVVGTLRTVKTNSTLSEFTPVSHWSGFSNKVTINSDGTVTLDCDNFFNDLINGKTKDSEWLLNKLISYRIKVKQALNKQDKKKIAEALAEALTEEEAKEILNNDLTKRLINSGLYKFYNAETTSDLNKAKKLINTIANIIFYDNNMDISDNVNNVFDKMTAGRSEMNANYTSWKEAVRINYTHTYELQKSFEEGHRRFIDLNVGYYTHLNIIRDGDQYNNVSELPFNPIPNASNLGGYTPFIMVNDKHQIVGEDGKTYGHAPLEIGEYSMGYIVAFDNDIPKIAYLNTRIPLPEDSDIMKAIEAEIRDIFNKQFNNSPTSEIHSHNDEFEQIIKKCIELFGDGGVFTFNNVKLSINNDRSIINVRFNGSDTIGFTIFRNNKISQSGQVTEGTGIRITGFNNNSKGFKALNDGNANAWIDSLIKELKKRVRINKSSIGFNKKDRNGVQPDMIDTSDGKFTIKLGGKSFTYANYGDFIHKTGGYMMDVTLRRGSFITRTLNAERISINMRTKDPDSVAPSNTDVSDLMFVDRKKKIKTVGTEDVLKAAGVLQEKIDILMGKTTGIQLLSKRIYPNDTPGAKGKASYNTKDKKIYVTPKGALEMNSNPSNTIRLLLHENIHRVFHEKAEYSQEERDRIVQELREVYDYLTNKLNSDRAVGNISEKFYQSIMRVLNTVNSYETEATRMEEFLVECLSQEGLMQYLNDTEYKEQAIVSGITQKKKTLLQKIIDIILKLFGINKENIKNNSILAREYLILSKGNKSTSSEIGIIPAILTSDSPIEIEVTDSTESPVEGELTDDDDYTDYNPLDDDLSDIEFNDFEEIYANTDYIDPNILNAINTEEQQILNHAPRDNQGRLLAPNGKPSNLTKKQYAQVRTKAFINWFGDWINDTENASKVVDENGEPLVVYHGSRDNTFEVFDVSKNDKGKKGFFFTNSKNMANTYGETRAFFLNSREPYVIDGKGANWNDINIYTSNIAKDIVDAVRLKRNALKLEVEKGKFPKENYEYFNDKYFKYLDEYNSLGNTIIDKIRKAFIINKFNKLDIDGQFLKSTRQTEAILEYDTDNVSMIFNDIKDYGPIFNLDGNKDMLNNIAANVYVTTNKDDIKSATDNIGTFVGDNVYYANTEQITPAEIFATPIANGSTESVYGVQIVNDINSFINSFPSQYRANIEHILAENDLNYTCQ